MKYIFFLIIFLIPVGLANAETGKNFDTVTNPDGSITWTSHYDRIIGNDWQWKNYILTDTADSLTFQSSGLVYSYEKNNCQFVLYDPKDNSIAIDAYRFNLSIDGLPVSLPLCNIENLIQGEDGISFTIDYTEFKTHYDLNPVSGVEWTHDLSNNLGKTSLYNIQEVCKGCTINNIDGNKIDFGKYILDTKNEQHDTFKETRTDKSDTIIEFEKSLSDKERFLIDPIFTSNNPTVDGYMIDNGADNLCSGDSLSKNTANTVLVAGLGTLATDDCYRAFVEYDITSIPDAATILNSQFLYDVQVGPSTDVITCDFIGMGTQPSVGSNAAIFSSIGSDTVLVNADGACDDVGNNKNLDLGSAGDSYIMGKLASDWVAIGIKRDIETGIDTVSEYTQIASEEDGTATPKPTLIIVYSIVDPVSDLAATDIRPIAVDLSWSQPALNGGSIYGYQVNFTTPWSSNVASIATNYTNNTSITISSLTGSTQYSFRIGVWEPTGMGNPNGNVLNITTDFDPTGSFTLGTFNLTQVGEDTRPIVFTRTDLNDTALNLGIRYDNSWSLACNFHYKFANTNKTYTSITSTPFDADYDNATFQFIDVDNEIIDVLCWDQNTNDTGRYLITQNAFPLLTYIQDFRAGEFGTSGMFGAIDFITMIAVILSMVGFNSRSPIVGVVFSVAILAGLAVFQIIQIETVAITGIVITVVFAIGMIRKDD